MKLALVSGMHDHNLKYHYRFAYRMLLAQHIEGREFSSKDYQIFKNFRRWGYFVMLDNGTAESVALSNVELMEAYDIVQPDELVLPDVWEDAKATDKAVAKFIGYHADTVPRHKRMLVPQGKTLDEWKKCLDDFVANFFFATIGVPKHLEGKEGGRVEALRHIAEKEYHTKYHVHLLGCFKDPIKEVREAIAIAPWIRGIDTAAPIAYAQAGKDIQCGEHHSYRWNIDFDEEAASYNLDKLLKACAGG